MILFLGKGRLILNQKAQLLEFGKILQKSVWVLLGNIKLISL